MPAHRPALHEAAHNDHTPVVILLLDAGWSIEDTTMDGQTPLALAAECGYLETAKCLLLRGANIDTQDNYKRTPLHEASRGGHNEMIKTLLHFGAHQEIRDRLGKTAEDNAENDETRALLKRDTIDLKLWDAAEAGDEALVSQLICGLESCR